MSRFIRTNKSWLLPLVLVAVVLSVAVPAWSRRDRTPARPREIVLLARDVSFWVVDRPQEPNPSLRLVRGQPVKLILRNDEPEKILHCFTIGGLDVKSSRDLAAGESETLVFTPNQSGTFTYACLMHPLMAGRVVVE
jgi:heme/copper-type cytochrome/quinol oxidase subunit 2